MKGGIVPSITGNDIMYVNGADYALIAKLEKLAEAGKKPVTLKPCTFEIPK